MLKVTYENLRDHAFARGMSKLANYPGFKNPQVSYNVAKINKRFLDEAALADELFGKLVKPYAVLDDKGNIAPANGVPGTFQVRDEAVEEWKGKLKEFLSMVIEIDRSRISLTDIAECGLTPLELGALEPVLAEPVAASVTELKKA